MFFFLSKLLWAVAQPSNLLALLIIVAAAMLGFGWVAGASRLLAGLAIAVLLILFLPLGGWLIRPMEQRFPELTTLPDKVDGIIVLGGAVDVGVMEGYRQIALNDQGERITALIELGRRYPTARLVYSDGIGSIVRPDVDLRARITAFLRGQGFDPARIIFEDKSRNTVENAVLSKQVVDPQPGERWLLVTSAYHMPRSVGIFRKIGWPVIAYPVDFQHARTITWHSLTSGVVQPDMASRLANLDLAMRAWVGLAIYWLTDKTSELFPGP